MTAPTSNEVQRNLRKSFSFHGDSTEPTALAQTAQFRRDLLQSISTDVVPRHSSASYNNFARGYLDPGRKLSPRKFSSLRPPPKVNTTTRGSNITTTSTLGLMQVRDTWSRTLHDPLHSSQRQRNPGVPTRTKSKANVEGLKAFGDIPKHKGQDARMHEDDSEMGSRSVGDAHERYEQAILVSGSESCSQIPGKLSGKAMVQLRHVDSPTQVRHAVSQILKSQTDLANNVQSCGDRPSYYTCDVQHLKNDDMPKGPFTIQELIRERVCNSKAKTGSTDTTCPPRKSYFIYPVLSSVDQTISWLSVVHSPTPAEFQDEVKPEVYGDDSLEIKTPWWELSAGDTAIGKALSKARAEKKQQQGMETDSQVIDLPDPKTDLMTTMSRIMMQMSNYKAHKSRLLDLFLESRKESPHSLPVEPQMSHPTPRPLLTESDTKENVLPADFLKMTPMEKNAFYSSPSMNRIANARWTPVLPYSPPSLELRSTTQETNAGYDPQHGNHMARPCRYSVDTLASFEEFCTTTRSLRGLFDAIDLYLVSNELELPSLAARQEFPDADARVSSMRSNLQRYVEAMKRLPIWLDEICIHTFVPDWFSRVEMELALERLKAEAVARTDGNIRWMCKVSGKGIEGSIPPVEDEISVLVLDVEE